MADDRIVGGRAFGICRFGWFDDFILQPAFRDLNAFGRAVLGQKLAANRLVGRRFFLRRRLLLLAQAGLQLLNFVIHLLRAG